MEMTLRKILPSTRLEQQKPLGRAVHQTAKPNWNAMNVLLSLVHQLLSMGVVIPVRCSHGIL